MDIIFAGTSDFALSSLKVLLRSKHRVIAVYTQPDRPSGRGLQVSNNAIKTVATTHRIPVHQPISLRDSSEQEILRQLQPDIMIVVAYGLLLPPEVLAIPKRGCINVHGSLLPRWRGAAPIQRAIEAGDKKTGITIMQMNEGLDTGDILSQEECAIYPTETSAELFPRLSQIGAEQLLEVLTAMEKNEVVSRFKDNNLATYAKKIVKSEA